MHLFLAFFIILTRPLGAFCESSIQPMEKSIEKTIVKHSNKLNTCITVEEAPDNFEPLKFNNTNNVIRLQGALSSKSSKPIHLYGTLVDKHCTPFQDAKILLWQMDEHGKYPYKLLRTHVDNSNVVYNKNFPGSATAFTNNLGKFNFVTVMPGLKKQVPYVNVKIVHPDVGEFYTKIYLIDKNSKNKASSFISRGKLYAVETSPNKYNFTLAIPFTVKLKKF